LSDKSSKTTNESMEKTRLYHEQYLRAVSNPLRRRILKAIKDGYVTVEDLKLKIGLDDRTLKWHLDLLEHDFCVEKEINQGKLTYRLTKEGRVIDYLE